MLQNSTLLLIYVNINLGFNKHRYGKRVIVVIKFVLHGYP